MSKVVRSPSKVQAKPAGAAKSPSKAAAPKAAKKPAAKPKATTKGAGAAGATKTKRERKPKSNAPKRPATAYIMYLSDNRQRIIAENPGIVFTDIAKVGSQEWKNVKPAIKKKYEDAANKDKERYANEMKTYVPDPADKKKKKAKKDPNAPKKPKSAYIFYATPRIKELLAQHPDKKVTEVTPMIGDEWKALSDKQKAPFVNMAAKDKVRYENEMKM